jgi:hypothetical protein
MGFHFVKAGTSEMQNVPSPAVDLAGRRAPKDLVEHDIRLQVG